MKFSSQVKLNQDTVYSGLNFIHCKTLTKKGDLGGVGLFLGMVSRVPLQFLNYISNTLWIDYICTGEYHQQHATVSAKIINFCLFDFPGQSTACTFIVKVNPS